MVKAVLVTHGVLGAELVRTIEGLLGPQSDVGFVSNAGTSLESLSDHVRELLGAPSSEEGGIFLFVDLAGGSCGHVCQQLRSLHPNTVVVSGINLPMLLEFFYNRDRVDFEELKHRVLEKGRGGIRCL